MVKVMRASLSRVSIRSCRSVNFSCKEYQGAQKFNKFVAQLMNFEFFRRNLNSPNES